MWQNTEMLKVPDTSFIPRTEAPALFDEHVYTFTATYKHIRDSLHVFWHILYSLNMN